ncbi:MAG: hypothetical protein E6H74_14435 [Betaproteobacteria bacterium]|nr:MAG: hypothetical protein E6H74_14435 [Betaproteobacteria bacterium]
MFGLFVDDGGLALTLIFVLAAVVAVAHHGAFGDALAMARLFGGPVGPLLLNVICAAVTAKR